MPTVYPSVQGPPQDQLLILNAGSSSLKFTLFEEGPPLLRTASGVVDRLGTSLALLTFQRGQGETSERTEEGPLDHLKALDLVLERMEKAIGPQRFSAIGHRVVHGGPRYSAPCRVDREMLDELQRIASFDPEHLPTEIGLMNRLLVRFATVPQFACFDTAFHHGLPRIAQMLPIPRRFEALGVHRYGFHGLSYAYLMEELLRLGGPEVARGRVVIAHLGSGVSMAAVSAGQPIDTTMGFTPAAGLMMGTRSGDVDPGLVSFLSRSEKMTAAQFDRMVNHESGLRGVSETSSDLRDLLRCEDSDVRAAEAVALFCYQVKKMIGSYAAALSGIDTLIFAGGIGENAAPVRARICAGLGFLGLDLDEARNGNHAPIISSATSRSTIRVIPTNEEVMIARSVVRLLETSEHAGRA